MRDFGNGLLRGQIEQFPPPGGRPLSVRLGDLRRNARQRARGAVSRLSFQACLTAEFDLNRTSGMPRRAELRPNPRQQDGLPNRGVMTTVASTTKPPLLAVSRDARKP